MYPITDDEAKLKQYCEHLITMFFYGRSPQFLKFYLKHLKVTKDELIGWGLGHGRPNPEQAKYLATIWNQPVFYYYYVPEVRDTFCWDEELGQFYDVVLE